ncbi:hypothetical protein RBU60_01380 [Mesonia sp. MT50]|uniref:Permease n=1 Tax=Mesonia profundi TaxID=3070998 RepID=A0ABU1A0H0_9FLAO|nr:hypothetical protein [Mesonia profundi]MDQ7916211.1 hypothetical protein [Mesonia profundi]
MIKKEILIGFLVALLATSAGIFLYSTLFLGDDFMKSLKIAQANDRLGSVMALGALLNFLPFFIFLKKDKIYRARGVILFTILTGVLIALINFNVIGKIL